jgi:hypothetical protein
MRKSKNHGFAFQSVRCVKRSFSKSRGREVDSGVPRWHSNAMGERIQIPDIPEEARTPLVKGLVELIEQLVQKVRQQGEKGRVPIFPVMLSPAREGN